MDPAIYFAVSGAKEERAIVYRPAIRIDPIINPGNTGQIPRRKVFSGAPVSVQ